MNPRFNEEKFVIRRKVLSLAGAQFHIYNTTGELMFFCKQKAFKLKEDIRLYTGEDMTEEVLTMHARSIIDFSATYDVLDPTTGSKIGALQRKGMKSLFKDEWVVLDAEDMPIGLIKEDNAGLALIRRLLTNLVPQNFDLLIGNEKAVDLKQDFNPFVYRLNVDYTVNPNNLIDRRLGIAAGILLAAIDGRQN